jgi:hypothetical protein
MYPRSSRVLDLVFVGAVAVFAVFLLGATGTVRSRSVRVAAVSAIAGVTTVLWSAASWRFGLWYPAHSFPFLLHRLYSTDGESSYGASDAQMFLVLFFVVSATWFCAARVRRTPNQAMQLTAVSLAINV